jgi:hypothetical protein
LTDSHKINFWDEKTESVIQISSQEFEQIMGARFVESTKMSPLTLANQWLKSFTRHSFTVTPRKIPKLQDGVYIKKMSGDIGYGIFALKSFEPGEVIGEYQGEWTGSLNRDDAEYSTQNINGAHLRGYVPFSAHGFPNAQLEPSRPQSGLSADELLVATTSIKPHQPVMWNYGTHEVVWGLYREQLTEALDDYVRRNGLNLRPLNPEAASGHHQNILTYILTTPTVLMRLVFERKIRNQDLKMFFDTELLSRVGAGSALGVHLQVIEQRLKSALKHFAAMDSVSRDNVYQFLGSRAREGNTQILHTLLGNAEHLCFDSLEQSWFARLKGKQHRVCSLERIERFWNKMWHSFCEAEGHQDFLKDRPHWGDCQAIGRAPKDETTEDLEDF